jgi:hypothetical protein
MAIEIKSSVKESVYSCPDIEMDPNSPIYSTINSEIISIIY